MTPQERNEGNQLISKFMESNNPPQYDYSWDWLMPVVQRIEFGFPDLGEKSKYFSVKISDCNCEIVKFYHGGRDVLFYRESNSKIIAVWKAVVAFITWYNTQKL